MRGTKNASPERGRYMKAVHMTFLKSSVAAALAGTLALSACTDPAMMGAGPNDPNRNTKNGALIGAASGALIGAATGNRDDALKGAVIGGAIGAGIGYSLDRQEAELRQAMGANVVITNTGDRLIVTLPQDILFATDSTAVQPALMNDLAALAQNVQIYANSTLQVIGHTDSDGDASYNQTLSEGRAAAVAAVLRQNGVPANRLQAFGRGESQPVASNLSPAGKAQNRRVEIVILPNAA